MVANVIEAVNRKILTQRKIPYILDTYVVYKPIVLNLPTAILLQDVTMQDPEEKKISADMEEIIKNIDSIIDRINHHDPGKAEETEQNEDLPT